MNSKELKLQQVKKNCTIIKTIISILMALLIASLIAVVAAITFIAFKGDEFNTLMINEGSGYVSIEERDFGLISWAVDMDKLMESGDYVTSFNVAMVIAIGYIVIALAILYIFRKIFIELEMSESPFSQNILKKLNLIFIIISIACLMTQGVGYGVMAWFITRLIYCILDYGCVIQTEIDETL